MTRSVLITGGGSAGWMTAAAIARAFGPRLSVRVLEDPARTEDTGVLGPFDATLPSLNGFNASLGLDDEALIVKAKATFRLGTVFRSWTRRDHDYVHPLGEFGGALDGTPFHHHWLRLKAAGKVAPFESFAIAAVAARAGRFSRPSDDPRSVTSTMAYGLHVDVADYVALVKQVALAAGVQSLEGCLVDIERSPDGEGLEAVVCDDGRRLEADLFIDATGQAGDLISRLGASWIDYSRWLPADRISGTQGQIDSFNPVTEARALRTGWAWRAPLGTSGATMRVTASAFESGDGEPATRFSNGRRSSTWIGNCIAIGLAATTLEPLEGSGLHLVQSGVSKLIGLFPAGRAMAAAAGEYNRLMAAEADRLRDLIILHYCANGRKGEPLWDAVRNTAPPDELAHKIRMFSSRGHISLYDEETFEHPGWIAVFMGQNIVPRRYHPMADLVPLDTTAARLDRMQAVIDQAVRAMPTHTEMLARARAERLPTEVR